MMPERILYAADVISSNDTIVGRSGSQMGSSISRLPLRSLSNFMRTWRQIGLNLQQFVFGGSHLHV